jgi:hypothetical protein
VGIVEDVAGRGEEDDDVVAGEIRVGELRRVLGSGHVDVVLLAELLDGGDAGGDGVMAEAGRL